MTFYFADTSALAKRYIAEAGSGWVRRWTRRSTGNTIVICQMTPLELHSTFARLAREGRLVKAKVNLQIELARDLIYQYFTIPLSVASIQKEAQRLVNRYPLRSLDALQLATALYGHKQLNQSLIFVSSDKRLLNAASAEGFTIDDPTNHP